ncbi:sensor histidine kinase [Romboutsia sedimentorum]|uniref:sensor histidine kinase n=1 Tax=Romboutsia sedimentorum TaxID=1368474 RepID=UPI0024DE48FE|nr:sensor histidine kinase [Romboutsia sedimentorum]MDK2587052.1 sensor histidine kinase [Romboutsia sedimentorum]
MSLMKYASKIIKSKKRFLITYLLNSTILILFYYLLYDSNEIIYPASISIFILVIYIFIEGFRFYKFEQILNDAKNSSNLKLNSDDITEHMVLSIINKIHVGYNNKIYKMKNEFKDRNMLFSQWIHNMKTSITVIDLASERCSLDEKSKVYIQDIMEENNKLKKNLEECLNVLRLDEFATDYIPERVNLSEIVSNVVNQKKRDFIYKGIYPKVEIDTNKEIYTDKKWCSYIIEQVISNSIKYSIPNENKKIYISMFENAEETILSIKDEGIGISAEDIPRVFDPFFTGYNGRIDRNATGIGLYMVKYISQKIGHKISINSKIGEWTEFKITFLSKM